MGDPTGEADGGALRLDFDHRLLLQFRSSTITSDAGLLPYRELDDALGLTDWGAETLADARTGKNTRHHNLSDGRGDGAATDVPGNPDVDRPTSGAAGTNVTGRSDATADDGRGTP
jgi:hypothetical protein